MNFISTFDELNKLYEANAEKVEESCTKEALTEETAEEEEIEIINDEVPVDEVESDEPKQTVLECSKCGALVIVDEVVVDEESDLVNVEDVCKFCEEKEGYKIIGSVVPYSETNEVETNEVIDNGLEEGVFDSKQKKYAELIKQVYKQDVSALVGQVASTVAGILTEAPSGFYSSSETDDDKNLAANIIKQVETARTTDQDVPQNLVKKIVSIGHEYKADSNDLDELNDFLNKADQLQSSSKDGNKAAEFLFSKLNPTLNRSLDSAISTLRKEFDI